MKKLLILLFLPLTMVAQNATNNFTGQMLSKGTNVSNVRASGGGGGGGPVMIFAIGKSGTGGGCTTSATNSTGSSILIYVSGGYRSPLPIVSDNKANTIFSLSQQAPGGGVAVKELYSTSPNVGTGHTFTADGGDVGDTGFSHVVAIGYSGITDVDAQAPGTNGTFAVLTVLQPCPLTPTTSSDVVVLAIHDDDATTTYSVPGYTQVFAGVNSSGPYGLTVFTKTKTDNSVENPLITVTATSGSTAIAIVMAAYKP